MKEYGVLLFTSTKHAMKAEKILKEKQIPAKIIATPEKIKASCGFSLKYQLPEEADILSFLRTEDVLFEGYYHATGKGLNISYRKVG